MVSILLIIILIAFIKITIHYNNPVVLAASYTLVTALINAAVVEQFTYVAITAAVTFVLTWLFFWLLDRFEDRGLWWLFVLLFPFAMFAINSPL